MLRPLLSRYMVLALVLLFVILASIFSFHTELPSQVNSKLRNVFSKPEQTTAPDPTPPHPKIVYKTKPKDPPPPPIKDNFPLATGAKSPADLPPIPTFNAPPEQHVPEATALLIGFTRNWLLLQQTVVGYITAGWPPEDIYVVDNTGTMRSNERKLLTLQNPFYYDYDRLTKVFGVNVLRTGPLLSFSQMQNFFLSYAVEKGWDYYFWSHMDVAILSEEQWAGENQPYKSLYARAVDHIRETKASKENIALKFFHYDHLELVNTEAFLAIGGWDNRIGYYLTDCDFHERLFMHNFTAPTARAGDVYDVSNTLDDLLAFYRRKPATPGKNWGDEDSRGSEGYAMIRGQLDTLQREKKEDKKGRNTWHTKQTGGQGEPFWIDPSAFQATFLKAVENGKEFYRMKWGWDDCGLRGAGLKADDEWQVERIERNG